jgi:FkbM family methyltransferase
MDNSNQAECEKWFQDNGDYTHNINYDLNENSVIMDLGGYTGNWAQQMMDKYNPNIYIIEPIPLFYNIMCEKFIYNKKIHLLNVGISTQNKEDVIFIDNDKTSSNSNYKKYSITTKFNTIETILAHWNLDTIDLLQMNIEGDEYSVLEYMIDNESIRKMKNIQIQFHIHIKDSINMRNSIQAGLISCGFKNNFNYPFVWESWRNENYI